MERMAAPPAYRGRYDLLHALRRIAAIAVLFYHTCNLTTAPMLIPHGWLAVDFFFMLSGFILAHAYTQRQPSMTLPGFLLVRRTRLLPLCALGVLLGFGCYLLERDALTPDAGELPRMIVATICNLALIPNFRPGGATLDTLYPLNPPLWKLALEFLVNLTWAAACCEHATPHWLR